MNAIEHFRAALRKDRESADGMIIPAEGKSLPQLTDYGSSPMRWTYDILLAEFNALRQEFQTLRQSIERTYGYMFAAAGAILASQLISNPAIRTLNQHPSTYLGLALIGLWFPLNNLVISVDMTSAGAYIRDVLAPKLNNLVELAATMAAQGVGLKTDDLIGWTSNVAGLLEEKSRDAARAPMSWEEFNPSLRYATLGRRSILIPMYTLRSMLLYTPSGLLVVKFASLSPKLDALQIILLALLAAVGVISTAALSSLSSHVRFGERRGPFKRRAGR